MTREEIAQLLERLDLRGRQLIVHPALDCFGSVSGGPEAVCGALMDAVGVRGTIVMPVFTAEETLPQGDAQAVAFHPELPASPSLGPVVEAFRRLPGVMRSNHPTHSFSAWGHSARSVLSTQRDNNVLGPLKKLNVMRGQVLLLGTRLDRASVLHLAEEQGEVPYLVRRTAVRINAAGYDEKVVLESVPGCGRAFERLEERLDPAQIASIALPMGTARLVAVRYLVQLAAAALAENPGIFICDDAACESCVGKRRALDQAGRVRRDAAGS